MAGLATTGFASRTMVTPLFRPLVSMTIGGRAQRMSLGFSTSHASSDDHDEAPQSVVQTHGTRLTATSSVTSSLGGEPHQTISSTQTNYSL